MAKSLPGYDNNFKSKYMYLYSTFEFKTSLLYKIYEHISMFNSEYFHEKISMHITIEHHNNCNILLKYIIAHI